MISLPTPYVLFLGDVEDRADAKTGFGIAHWLREDCIGQVRLSPTAVNLGLPDMDFAAAAAAGARTAIIGIANDGGYIAPAWLPALLSALTAGLDLAAGLHERLADVPELASAARRLGRRLYDVRRPEQRFTVGSGIKRSGRRLLTIGTDCAVGKKYTALALARELKAAGISATFRATGQTGILLSGGGVCIDAVVADFIAGAAEALSPAASPTHWDIIEGQGSLFHPAFAGVSLGLLHGSQPDLLVVCHEAGRNTLSGYAGYPVPSLHQCAASGIAAARLTNANVEVLGFSINTSMLPEDEARALLDSIAGQHQRPATDPIRFGVAPLVARIGRHLPH